MADTDTIRARADNVLIGHGAAKGIAARLREVADFLDGSEQPDLYGRGAYLQNFEAQVAAMFGKQTAVFMPSGTMAQQIALRIWCERAGRFSVAMHPTSHLEMAEHAGLQFLHDIKRLQFGGPEFLRERLLVRQDFEELGVRPGALLLELPCRPLGGQLPAWEELQAISAWAKEHGIALHLDGARIWQCQTFYQRSLAEIAALFDSVYVSFYKDLGGIAGCMLIGEASFIAESRVWQRRYGGNLFDQSAMVAAARQGMSIRLPQLPDWARRAREVAAVLSAIEGVRIRPNPPQVNFFQLYLPGDPEVLLARHHELAEKTGTFIVGALREAAVPGYAMCEVHCFANAMRFDLDRLAPFVRELLAP